jgi:hypothetical protein
MCSVATDVARFYRLKAVWFQFFLWTQSRVGAPDDATGFAWKLVQATGRKAAYTNTQSLALLTRTALRYVVAMCRPFDRVQAGFDFT